MTITNQTRDVIPGVAGTGTGTFGTWADGGMIELRTGFNGVPAQFTDGSTTAGVGFVNGDLFRAWWPRA